MGSAFQARDLDQFLSERAQLASFSAGAFSRGENPGPDVAFILGPASYAPSGSAADLRAALPEAKTTRGFTFLEVSEARFYIFPVKHGLQEYVVGFPYADFRARLDSSSRLVAESLILSAGLVLLVFPLLFRASLVLPLRFLLDDLRRLGEAAPVDSGQDEIGKLRESFRKMADLLKETRSQIPAFAPHLEEMESYAAPEEGQITVGSRTLVYRSRAMRRMIEQIERAREYRHAVLITGETGTGKELAARMIHSGESLPFVAVNCAALPETLWESEIFGHKKGAFTDAKTDRKGRVAEAGGGTLFFDEIGEMPAVMQAKMLRLLQESQFTPLGSDVPSTAACRFVFATNRDLAQLVQKKQFREDLLYRIRVFHIQVPSLRDRPEDIPDLVRFFVARFAEEHGTAVPEIDAAAMHGLVRYSWPGNIREVENAVVRAMAAGGPALNPGHFAECQIQSRPALASDGRIAYDEEINRYSRALIEQALQMAEGNKTRAAGILGLKRTTLRYRMRELGLEDAPD
jgi:DNA-binding NtrC family response regulator